ncbi:uncharacterized protein LOC109706120 [Ananas comosus]|uniref:Uncharacterized protein LOC109706120 n=1 Tax=Ananas comosus TaxID=4615 RepID=A0A6P5EMB6_ANACO|nr:uncharacterized protein LOC109706120 [Ananas comosus]
MDKSWMKKPRSSTEYKEGVNQFLDFAFRNASNGGKIMCPCIRCVNSSLQTLDDVKVHLICDGFLRGYTRWICHGEDPITSLSSTNPTASSFSSQVSHLEANARRLDDIDGLLHAAMGISNEETTGINFIINETNRQQSSEFTTTEQSSEAGDAQEPTERADAEQCGGSSNGETSEFLKLLKDANEELYPDCMKFSKLSFIIHLFHLKCLNGWTGESFSKLLELLIDAFPEGTLLPRSTYEAKKVIKALGLNYEKIHCCPNDCMLFWGEKASEEICHVCSSSRWVTRKQVDKEAQTHDKETMIHDEINNASIKKKRKAAKVLRYFPLIPRLQRLFVSTKTAKDMRWHEEGRVKDGLLRHPADGKAWRAFDEHYPDFSSDSRNVRLGLASDGFNPFRTMNTTYSTWPVVIIPYNLPPWICMKQSNFILSMIIPGKRSPGNDIDIFLQPLIEELKQLWEGVDTYDAFNKQTFHMRAMLMWTINDFPAYGNLSGWSTKGKYACPYCAENTHSKWLYNGRKYCYMGHRRWLSEDHTFRYQNHYFDGSEELRMAPTRASGCDVLRQLECVKFTLGKSPKQEGKVLSNRKKDKKSIKKSKRRRQMMNDTGEPDVQDIATMNEKLRDAMRSKDNLKARLDLVDLGIRPELHPQILPNDEIKLGGPVQYRWMYPQERFFVRLKSYVRNRAHPEGSIAEGYIAEECLTFCSRQFIDMEKRKRRRHTHLTAQDIEKLVSEKFHEWFEKQVMRMDNPTISQKVATLGRGPNKVARRLSGFIINGFRYHTISREENRKTQNSGVVNTSEIDGVNYYGRLRDIIELNYYGNFKVVLFKCDWIDVHHSSYVWNLSEEERIEIEVDKYGCPCTEEGAVLSSFLGVIAKNGRFAPLDIPRWDNKALNSYKEKMLKLIESKFSYPISTRDWVLASLNKKWRDYKSELKSEYFHPHEKSTNEIMANVPQDVIEDQWCRMVSEWCTEKSKKLCEANAANSRTQKNAHTSGRKSHARRRKELSTEVDKLKGEIKDMREEVDRLRALISQKFPEENIGSPSPAPVPPINPQVVHHSSANYPFPNLQSSFSSHEPSNADLRGRTI